MATTKKAPTSPKVKARKEAITKSEMMKTIAEEVGITRKQVTEVFDSLKRLIHGSVKKNSVGEIKIPGLLKVKIKKVAARKARKGTNPFTGEEMMFKAKPAQRKVKITPLKELKEMAEN